MRFFNLDCHVSVVSDIKNIFEQLGHTVEAKSLSGHRWVMNLPRFESPVIDEKKWKDIDQKMVDEFYEIHKKELDHYDAFLCCYPPIFVKLFEKFNKPIIVVAATRYDFPVLHNNTRLLWLEDSLINNQNIIKIANNQFDQKYCEKFLGNTWKWIPSLCDYTNAKHDPLYDKIVAFSKFPIQFFSPNYIHKSELGIYTWKKLYSHKAIIHFPHNVSIMSIFEQSQAEVPMHFPSLDFCFELIDQGYPIFSEIVGRSDLPERHRDNFLNKKWLSYSDFYNGTISCNYFDSDFILNHNHKPKTNKPAIFEKWKSILNNF